jgi:hypothetical protein
MEQFLSDLTHVIRNGDMENTYKMAWARSIVESCVLEPTREKFSFDTLSKKIFGYYWNQTIFFDLEQCANTRKRPVVHQIVKDEVDFFRAVHGSKPAYFSRVEHNLSVPAEKISKALTKDVCWRFLKVGGNDYDLYDLDRKNRTILIHRPGLIREYADILFELINYRWTQKLEELNNSPKISMKVRGTDREKISRKSLFKFRKYLDVENPDHLCFVTGEKISDDELSIDHVIPWSYIFSDDIWNLVYVSKPMNSSKNGRIPIEASIAKLEGRNSKLSSLLNDRGWKDKHTDSLGMAIEKDFVRKNWVGSRG